MANVDMTELIPQLEAYLSIPGQESVYADATDDEWTAKIVNAFWRAVLDGVIVNYSIDEDGIVSPISGDTTFAREYQQVVIIYAAINIVKNAMLQTKTLFRAHAGSVEYETQQASQVLTGLLRSFEEEKNIILERLSDIATTNVSYIDSASNRLDAYRYKDTYWIGY